MNLKVRRQLNCKTWIEAEFTDEKDLKEAILKATPFLEMPEFCEKCKSTNLVFHARNTKGGEFIYPEVLCLACKCKKPMGEYKNPKGALFFKQWEDPYKGDKADENND
jgi:hypothetical protein